MRFQDNYTVCEIAGDSFIMPIGDEVCDVGGLLTLNDTSAFIVEKLKNDDLTREQLIELLFDEFEAPKEVIAKDLDVFLGKAFEIGFIK